MPNAVTAITESVYAELQALLSQSANIADQIDEKGLDDTLAIIATVKIKEAMSRVTAVQSCAKFMDSYTRGTDMATDTLMAQLEALPENLREAVEVRKQPLGAPARGMGWQEIVKTLGYKG